MHRGAERGVTAQGQYRRYNSHDGKRVWVLDVRGKMNAPCGGAMSGMYEPCPTKGNGKKKPSQQHGEGRIGC